MHIFIFSQSLYLRRWPTFAHPLYVCFCFVMHKWHHWKEQTESLSSVKTHLLLVAQAFQLAFTAHGWKGDQSEKHLIDPTGLILGKRHCLDLKEYCMHTSSFPSSMTLRTSQLGFLFRACDVCNSFFDLFVYLFLEADLPRCLMWEILAALHISGKAILGSEIPKQTIMEKRACGLMERLQAGI